MVFFVLSFMVFLIISFVVLFVVVPSVIHSFNHFACQNVRSFHHSWCYSFHHSWCNSFRHLFVRLFPYFIPSVNHAVIRSCHPFHHSGVSSFILSFFLSFVLSFWCLFHSCHHLFIHSVICHLMRWCGFGGSVARFGAFRPESRRFESHSSRPIKTSGKSFTHSCLYSASACKLRHSVNCCGRERFWKAHAVRSAIEIDKYNTVLSNCISISCRTVLFHFPLPCTPLRGSFENSSTSTSTSRPSATSGELSGANEPITCRTSDGLCGSSTKDRCCISE